jgi:hypothetical protein
MAQGQVQLSMEETKERKGRDKRAIRWLLDNLTEDADESFAMSIPGTFNGEWSFEVWFEMSKFGEDDAPIIAEPSSKSILNVLGLIPHQLRKCTGSRSSTSTNAMLHQPALNSAGDSHPLIITTSIPERNAIRELCSRIGHLSDTCKNRAVFASDELWRRRARACIEAMASLVCYAGADIGWFGDILGTLGNIGSFEGMRNLSLAERDQAFVVRWTCLSIMSVREILRSNVLFKEQTSLAVASFGEVRHSDGTESTDEATETNAREIDETLEARWSPGAE